MSLCGSILGGDNFCILVLGFGWCFGARELDDFHDFG